MRQSASAALITKNKKLRDAVIKSVRRGSRAADRPDRRRSFDRRSAQSYSTEVYEEYIERRKCLIDGLNPHSGRLFISPIPMGAFYTVARLPSKTATTSAHGSFGFRIRGRDTSCSAPASASNSDPTRGRSTRSASPMSSRKRTSNPRCSFWAKRSKRTTTGNNPAWNEDLRCGMTHAALFSCGSASPAPTRPFGPILTISGQFFRNFRQKFGQRE